jgi:hypothetical protein
VIPAEFEEQAYEAPLYNQLERGNPYVFTPGQVLENKVGFDRGCYISQVALWETLGYKSPLKGAALAYYDWPFGWGPLLPREQLPKYRMNLFLQVKRPIYYQRKPRAIRSIPGMSGPLWGFRISEHQQRLLEILAAKTRGRAHVSYAAAAFHTKSDLFGHTTRRTIVQNSTFPSVDRLSGHEAWYYRMPGATGAANPKPENIEEPDLLDRVLALGRDGEVDIGRDMRWLIPLAVNVVEAAAEAANLAEGVTAHFFDGLLALSRHAERYNTPPVYLAYAWADAFQTFDWEKAIPTPDVAVKEIGRLLALAS